jgi:hypothetical protein
MPRGYDAETAGLTGRNKKYLMTSRVFPLKERRANHIDGIVVARAADGFLPAVFGRSRTAVSALLSFPAGDGFPSRRFR